MNKFIKIKYKAKPKDGVPQHKEMVVHVDTIKRLIPDKRVIMIITPVYGKGFKNQALSLEQEDFDKVMEAINATN